MAPTEAPIQGRLAIWWAEGVEQGQMGDDGRRGDDGQHMGLRLSRLLAAQSQHSSSHQQMGETKFIFNSRSHD